MQKHIVTSLLVNDKGERSVKTRTGRHNLGRRGEPLTPYLGERANDDVLELPQDLRDVRVTVIDFEGERDPRSGLYPAYAGAWSDVDAPDLAAPTIGLQSAESAVLYAVETLEGAAIIRAQADAVASALDYLDAALADIGEALTLAQNEIDAVNNKE